MGCGGDNHGFQRKAQMLLSAASNSRTPWPLDWRYYARSLQGNIANGTVPQNAVRTFEWKGLLPSVLKPSVVDLWFYHIISQRLQLGLMASVRRSWSFGRRLFCGKFCDPVLDGLARSLAHAVPFFVGNKNFRFHPRFFQSGGDALCEL